ncbi:zinc transporter ZIP1-like [Littorina saxatilis]|uniref:Uncharacterized protein n=1 Tax=Littorina saxatilis TaxID=31220 RepID=A0AAN9FXT0_9CAEN
MDPRSEKGIVLVIFFLITIIPGMLPILLFTRCRSKVNSTRGQTVLSLLNCFAGGVFLATCLLNLLVEGFEQYQDFKEVASFHNDYPFFHLAIAVGFFFVALVERVAVFLSRKTPVMWKMHPGVGKGGRMDHFGHSREIVRSGDSGHAGNILSSDYLQNSGEGVKSGDFTHSGHSGQVVGISGNHDKVNSFGHSHRVAPDTGVELTAARTTDLIVGNSLTTVSVISGTEAQIPSNTTASSPQEQGEEKRKNTGDESEDRFSAQSGLRALVMLLALSFHTIFDGLAVGLQDTDADIWTTAAAISIHKIIVAVSLGLELATALASRPLKAFLLLFVFALMAPLGLAIGMGVTSGHVNERAHLLAGSLLQAVATGSFLYVTFFEVLAEELGCASSVLKIVVTAAGFGAMALAKIWDTD